MTAVSTSSAAFPSQRYFAFRSSLNNGARPRRIGIKVVNLD